MKKNSTTTPCTPSDLSKFKCTAEWHMARLPSPLASPIYNFSLYLSCRTQVFWPSIPTMAEYFGVSNSTVRRAVHELRDAGFFELTKNPSGKPRYYRPINHTDWAKRHPNRCVRKIAMPWEHEEKDPLAIRLYALSGGETFYGGFLKGTRNLGFSDDAIALHFADFFAKDHGGRTFRFKRFMTYLRERL